MDASCAGGEVSMNLDLGEKSITKIALMDYISDQTVLLEEFLGREESSFSGVKTKAEYIADIESRLKRAESALNKMNNFA